ncbi:hypothetical protein EX30DRAFT_255897 [Ascodesmis nigricans]|uniref:Uncharacterized protein n=1 Tax=Ascodesmis nigricans TaxID=341454 RepID=A0A4S2MHM3_9PEZI|nr:hypothetical protein EX30DRAFT_255897 [Ascodesmis nigricans]
MVSPIASLGSTPPKPPHRITSRPQPDPPYHDPDLDITFALAIITAYTPPPTPSSDSPSISNSLSPTPDSNSNSTSSFVSGSISSSGSVSSDSPFCTHTFVTRHKIPHRFRCPSCRTAHWIGWRLCCESCGLSGCGECRGYWVERTFGTLDGVLIQAKNRPALRRGSLVEGGSLVSDRSSTSTTMTTGTVDTETTAMTAMTGEATPKEKGEEEDGVRRTLEEKRAWYTPDEIDEGFEIDVELVKMLV